MLDETHNRGRKGAAALTLGAREVRLATGGVAAVEHGKEH